MLIARYNKNEKLTEIRRFGETLKASDSKNSSRLDGWFSLKAKFNKDDVLLVGNPGTLYWGAALIPIGKAIPQ